MKTSMQFEEILQPSAIQSESDTSICIQEIHSKKASAVAHLEVIEDKSLSLQDIEILPTKTDATFTLTSNNVFPQSQNEGNVTFDCEVAVSENLNKSNLQEKYSKLATKFPDKNITNRESNTREEVHSEIAFVSPHIGAFKEESMGDREVSRFESDDKITAMLDNIFTRQRMKQISHIWTNLLILKI
ncbi:unnamed protein product [Clavelina lepadiformis]|uniref:Uncharacterized protein n=1 Tax=Clavelina lepadiformis TaxID=159417 RepID=A0ABP0EXI3_CLALP